MVKVTKKDPMVLQAEILYILFEPEISLHLFQGIFASSLASLAMF